MNDIWLVRHGETEWTLSKQHTSRTDVELTEHGEQDARALAAVLGDREFALVLTSPRVRARRTAELAGFPDAIPDDEPIVLREAGFDGRTTTEIRAERPGWYLWTDGSPGGERPVDAGRRADRVVARIRAVAGPVLIVGHGHMSRILAARLLELPPEDGRLLVMDPATISIVGSEHDRPAITLWNWSPTLE